MTIDAPGIYRISQAEYLADPCPEPSLNSHVATALLQRSALHAKWLHPRLSPALASTDEEKFEIGRALHSYLLEGDSGFEIIHHSDFRTKAAREARDTARAQGRVPLLADRWADVQAAAASARVHLDQHADPPVPLAMGAPEMTLIWREGSVWCRARLDWLHDDGVTVDDLKSAESANPDVFARTLWTLGYDVQAAFYLRGLKAVTGRAGTFRFVVVETRPPYACSVVALDPAAMALAERRVAYAIEAWRYCLETNRWEGYPRRTCWVSAPPWMETKQAEREYRTQEAPVVDDGRDVSEQLMERLR